MVYPVVVLGDVVVTAWTSFGPICCHAVAKAGEVTFHISNHSTDTKHNFVVYKTDLAGDKLPMDNKGDVIGAQLTKVGEMEVDKGNSRDLKVDLTPGHYVAVSNLDGQYKAGMHVDLTVMP